MNKKDIEKIDEMIYGIEPLFPVGYGFNRFASIVWERIKEKLKKV